MMNGESKEVAEENSQGAEGKEGLLNLFPQVSISELAY